MVNDSITRGTTPLNVFRLKSTLPQLSELWLTYKQGDSAVIEKELSDVEINDTELIVKLTQQETLRLTSGVNVLIQIRLLTQEGEALASNVIEVPVYDVLKGGIIGDD